MDRSEPWARRTVLQGLALGGLVGGGMRPAPAAAAPETPGPGPSQNTAVIWGDSITAARDGSDDKGAWFSADGYWTWAEILARRRVRLARNAGVGGENTGQVLARFDADVRPYDGGWVVIECGTNDLVPPSPSATAMTANLASMLDKVGSTGATAILCTIPPRDGISPTQKTVSAQVNRWIRAQPFLRPRVAVADFWQALVDPATGDMLPALGDGIHPNASGAYRCGGLLAAILDQQTPPLDVAAPDLADPLLLSANPAMTGSSGGAGLHVEGEVASDWSLDSPGLEAGRAKARKLPRLDGIPGEWQQVAVPSATRVRLFQVQDDVGGSWTPGTTQVYAVCEFESDPDWSQVTDFHLEVAALNQWLEPRWTVTDLRWADDDTWLPWSPPASGVLQTPVMSVPASADKSLVPAVVFNGVGTFRVGRFALYKVA